MKIYWTFSFYVLKNIFYTLLALWKPFSIGFFKDHYISYKQDSLYKSKFDKERIIELKLQISYDIFQVVDEMGS
jgi:hypothetical protein